MDITTTFAQHIRARAASNTLSHAIILSGPGDKLDYAKFISAALLCASDNDRPCLHCNNCRKVTEGIHPDYVLVQDDSHKELPVELIRSVRQDAYILPNEGKHKIYIFPNCDQLNERDQNVLLKIVEEGPAYAVFIFCVESASSLLETIRSRCIELKTYTEAVVSNLGDALSLMQTLAKRNPVLAAEYIFPMEKQYNRAELKDLLNSCWYLSSETLFLMAGKVPDPDLADSLQSIAVAFKTKKRVYRLVSLFDKYCKECNFNINVGQLLSAMFSELEEIL